MASAAGGGVKRPASPSDIIQWLTAYDGVTPFVDRKDIVTSPVATDVNCLSFDGTNDVVNFNTDSFDGVDCYADAGNVWSTHQWMKVDNGDQMFGLSRGVSTSAARPHLLRFARGISADWTPAIWINGEANAVNLGLDDGQWHHYVITWDGTTCKLYVDGAFSTNLTAGANPNVDHPWLIGKMSTSYGDGETGTCGVYNRTLSADEVADVFAGSTLDGSVMQAPLQEGSGTVAHDVSGNGNHGTITGATWTTADDIPSYNLEKGFRVAVQGTPPYIPALAEPTLSQLTFDGASDYITSEDAVSIPNGTASMTTVLTIAEDRPDDSDQGFLSSMRLRSNREFCVRLIGHSMDAFIYGAEGTPQAIVWGDVSEYLGKEIEVEATVSPTELTVSLNGVKMTRSVTDPLESGEYDTIIASRVSATNTLAATYKSMLFTVDGIPTVEYDFTKYLGKTTEVISDESGNGNDGTILTTDAASLATMWGTRFADSSGTVVDAGSYLTLTNKGGYVHNGAECSIQQTSQFFVPDADINCLSFDGTGGVIGPADLTAFATANKPFTMTFDGVVGSNDSTTHQVLVTLGIDPYAVGAIGGLVYRKDSGKIRLRLADALGVIHETTTTTVIPLGERVIVEGVYDGETISIKLNGTQEGTPNAMTDLKVTTSTYNFFGVGVATGGSAYPMQAGGFAYSASVTNLLTFPFQEGSGNPYDVSGNDNHATTNTATWTTATGIPNYNRDNGYYWDDPVKVPALADGSGIAADGNAVDVPAGYAVTTNFWYTASLDEKTKANLDTHFNNTNGSYNLWLKYQGDNTYESVQYPLDKEFTPGEVVKNENYFGGTSGALRDVDGEFILDVDGYVIFTA